MKSQAIVIKGRIKLKGFDPRETGGLEKAQAREQTEKD